LKIFDGNLNDVSNFTTDKFLKVNSCGFQNPDSGYTVVRKNGRQDWHILLVSKGTCLTLHNEKLHTMSAGDMVIYAPYEEQMYSYTSDGSSLWCHFTGTIIEELFMSTNIKSGVYSVGNNKAIFDSFSNLIRIFHLPGRENFANSSFLELIYNISDGIKNHHQSKGTDALLSVLSYINENYSKNITIEDLAKKAGYSKSRFSHIFSEVTGTTPIKYQNDIRLKTSCEMLSSTQYPISEIAIKCGFSDPLYYSRVFKKKYGVSPTDYRKSALNI